jgi:drug/metabolite transporter (DMT)-like permease
MPAAGPAGRSAHTPPSPALPVPADLSPPSRATSPLDFPWQAVALAVFINALWGGNAPAIKLGLIAVPPLWIGFWRFLLGVLCVGGWAWSQGIALWPRREEWLGLSLLGLLFTVQIGLMNVGIRFTTAALGSIFMATNPLFAGLYAHLALPGERLSPNRGAGLLVAFVGVSVIFLRDLTVLSGTGTLLGNLICLFSAALLGGRLVFASRLLQRIDSTRVVVWQMLFSLPCFALAGWFTEQVRWERLGWYPLAGIAYQGIIVAGFNFMALAYLLKRYSPSVVASFNFLSPVFGVLVSFLLLSEALSWPVLVGLVAVGGGLYLITRR